MKDINQVTLLGNVGSVEVKTLPSGDSMGRFSVATTERWKDKSGEWQEKTEWHKCVVFKPYANGLEDKIWKGCRVFAQGKVVTRKYQDQDGNDRYSTEVVVNNIALQSKREKREAKEEPAGKYGNDNEPSDWNDEIPF